MLAQDGNVPVFVRRTRITNPVAYGVRVTNGGFAVIENSIIKSTVGYPVALESNDPGTVIATIRQTTIAGPNNDPDRPAIDARVDNVAAAGPINLVVRDTIIADHQQNAISCEAPANPT